MSDENGPQGPTDPWGRPMPPGSGPVRPPSGPVPPTRWPSAPPPASDPGAWGATGGPAQGGGTLPPPEPRDDWWGAPDPKAQARPAGGATSGPPGPGTGSPFPPAGSDQFPQPGGAGQQWPGGPLPQGGYQGPPVRDGGSTGALVLGIASLVCCGILGIPFGIGAIVTGTTSRKRIAASSGRLLGEGNALAGVILGVIGLILSTLATIYLFTNPDAFDDINRMLETTTTTTPR